MNLVNMVVLTCPLRPLPPSLSWSLKPCAVCFPASLVLTDFFIYSRHFNPTVLNLGRQMDALEGTEADYCTARGTSANHQCCYNFAVVEDAWWHQGLSMEGSMHYSPILTKGV
ncbi:hypothetical protein NC652_009265 [Populus alba x Populus x berolinensis]|nr:hypothetical protein NC652_009265 [Populus alba x Populus x berolinensis]